jgi:adenosylcobinamide kinase/adenosylcobinamide-phosphate guanylyltransferase
VNTLVLGGTRSGKSKLAESLAQESEHDVTYIATAQAKDGEMQRRIDLHRARRPASWQLVEEPLQLAACLERLAQPNRCLLIDCMTLWLTNLLLVDPDLNKDEALRTELDALYNVIPTLPGHLIMVSNETNMGITPLGELSRKYCDEAGLLHQRLAALSDRVILTVAGLPHYLKGQPHGL